MANEEHLARLLQGEAAWDWNEWREHNPHIVPDLRGASLIGGVLTLALLDRVDLAGADLRKANLHWGHSQVRISLAPLLWRLTSVGPISVGRSSLGHFSIKRTSVRLISVQQSLPGRSSPGPISLERISAVLTSPG